MKTLKELESETKTTMDFEYLQPVNAACEKCGDQLYLYTRMVLTSYPPKYTYICKRCGNKEKSYLRLKTEKSMRPSTAEKCIDILDDIKAIIENEEEKRAKMNDLISRQAAIDALGERPIVLEEWADEYSWTAQAADHIESMPSFHQWISVSDMNNLDEWSTTLEMTEESSSNLLKMLEQHDKEFIGRLFDGKEELRLILGEKEVVLAPVKKRGTWSDISGQACLCSVCGRPQNYKQAMGWKYCPCCGAKMNEGG